MENIKIKVYGFINVNKKQFVFIYAVFIFIFIFLTVYFSLHPVTTPEGSSGFTKYYYENFELQWIVFLVWTIIEGLLFWNNFAQKQLKIIQQQKFQIEEQNLELRTQKEEITAQRDEIEAQRDELVIQRDTIAHQKKEIMDSINYAYRIQKAILPPDYYIKKLLPQSFVFYKPKDVVSGDFFYFEKFENKVIFSAVDCTGHGVPGAMMSVIGFNILNQAVKINNLSKPADILSFLDAGVTETLRQMHGESGVNDGMDIALCTIDLETHELQYAGAYNSVVYIHDGQMIEIKADKFPIGVNYDGVADNYTNHSVFLSKGDMVYLYSDGYADQFGGPDGKKFKYKPLREFLMKNYMLEPEAQKEMLSIHFNDWKGSHEQVDDVMIIGIKI